MLRKLLLMVLMTVNAGAPALAGHCAMHCELASAASSHSDCRDAGAFDNGTQGGMDGSPEGSLMQAACVFAATAAVTPTFGDVLVSPLPERVAPATSAFDSLPAPPPDQPPRA